MKIPVFVSCPNDLNDIQMRARELIDGELEKYNLAPRALGRSDYPTEFPLREVLVVAKHCSGGIVLGFQQMVSSSLIRKVGTKEEEHLTEKVAFPTPWNNLEAGILFALNLPLLIFKEDNIAGGVFDVGTTDVFVHNMPKPPLSQDQKEQLKSVLLKWQASVRQVYYEK